MNNNFNIVGAYGESNFGDDLLMLVFEQFFIEEFPNSKVNFIGEKNSYPNFLLRSSSYNSKLESNILVYGGGTQFFSFRNMNESILKKLVKFSLNPRLILHKLKSVHQERLCFPYVAFLGFGIGPFNNDIKAIENARRSLESGSFVGVRDDTSFEFCREYNIEAFLGADVVFSSYFESFLYNIAKKERNRINKVGIIVRDWPHINKEYIDKIVEFEKKTDFDTTFIIFSRDKDKSWISILKNYPNKIVWDPMNISIKDFLEILNSFDCIISARYHGAIISALLGIPTICIEIEPKLEILSKQIEGMLLWRYPFNIEKLNEYISELSVTTPDYSESLAERKRAADSMLLQFKQYMEREYEI
ncbi:MAG: polysaccharide pyruvyl transferase family protein [[Actinobacillus] rossii]|nr:polysaccharide pyruvyl transferase family protein [[Actinobacillus] rossii]